MSAFTEEHVTIESDGLRLEGALHEGGTPRDGSGLAAVVLHPHPQYGGDMDNHVVLALCRTLGDVGAGTLRFNFRGAGRSEGSFDGGHGEAHDAIAACEYVRSRHAGALLVLAGYSFGAGVAAAVAADVKPDALVLVSPPAQMMPKRLAPGAALLLAGGRDPIAPPEPLRALEGRSTRLVVVEEADHGWWPGADRLAEAVREFVGNLLPEQ